MKRILCWAWAGTATLLLSGCMTGPLLENPLLCGPAPPVCDNPVFVPLGPNPHVYGVLFEKVLESSPTSTSRSPTRIVTTAASNRFQPRRRVSASRGSPAVQTSISACWRRTRAFAIGLIVLIQPAQDGGYFIEVQVLKELEDLPRPIKAAASCRRLPRGRQSAAAVRSHRSGELRSDVDSHRPRRKTGTDSSSNASPESTRRPARRNRGFRGQATSNDQGRIGH